MEGQQSRFFLNSLCTNTQIQTTRASLLKESIKIFNLPVGINVLVGSHKERRPFASPPKDPIQNLPAVLTVAEAFGGGASRLRPQMPPNLGDVTWCRAPAERGGSGPRFSSGQRLPNISHHLFKSKWRRAASGGCGGAALAGWLRRRADKWSSSSTPSHNR